MKKLIAIVLAVLALSSLTVCAFAAGSQEPAQEEEAAAALTQEQALAAALRDAGLKETDVTVDRNKLTEKETTDGQTVAVYSVKFSTDTTTCKYYIDANTGAILYKSVVFQAPGFSFSGRSDSSSDGDMSRGSGDKSDSGASEEMTEDASGAAGSGRGRRSASAESETEAALTDPAAA